MGTLPHSAFVGARFEGERSKCVARPKAASRTTPRTGKYHMMSAGSKNDSQPDGHSHSHIGPEPETPPATEASNGLHHEPRGDPINETTETSAVSVPSNAEPTADRRNSRKSRRDTSERPARVAQDACRERGFVMWGPPGSGKTSLCEALSHRHGLVHVSTGDLLRAHVRYQTEPGQLARPYLLEGEAVPDDIVVPIVLQRISMADCVEHGFILDGFPRSVAQDDALRDAGFEYRAAFMLHAPRTVLERRIRERRVDPESGLLYNLRYRRPEEQEVLERLVPLEKDVGRNISQLLALYGRMAADMFDRITSYSVRIDADRELEAVLDSLSSALESHGVIGSYDPAHSPTRSRDDSSSPSRYTSSAMPDRASRATAAVAAVAPKSPDRAGSAVDGNDGPPRDGDVRAHEDAPRSYGSYDANGSDLRTSPTAEKKSPITLIRCDGYMCERESVDGSNIAFRGAATEQVMLVWNRRPTTALLLAKKDPELMVHVLEAARYLGEVHGLRVVVEPKVQTEALANGLYLDAFTQPEHLHEEVDFVICLGGDGLILHVSTLFETAVPPVLSFNLGSLGFLTPFDYDNFHEEVSALLDEGCLLSLRMRLTCTILRKGEPVKEFEVLNEVVVDRGASPYLSNLDCFCDDKYITTVQADGIIMSTPTGSTAYSMSAGGSMVHPSVPAILFTPICPHSLSFRPIVFPDAAKLRIDIAEDARSHAWASFDGKFRQQLRRGDGLLVQMSLYPVPTVNKTDHTGDWFQSLDRAFNFNSRAIQKGFQNEGTKQAPRKQMGIAEQRKREIRESSSANGLGLNDIKEPSVPTGSPSTVSSISESDDSGDDSEK